MIIGASAQRQPQHLSPRNRGYGCLYPHFPYTLLGGEELKEDSVSPEDLHLVERAPKNHFTEHEFTS